MILFSKKIKCLNCGGNFKSKKEKGNRVYVCSRYDNHGDCIREVFHQDYILELLDRRFDRRLTDAEIKEKVEKIEVETRSKFKIHLKDDDPIVFGDNYIIF